MIRVLWLLWFACALPGIGVAQPVAVTSGEHEGFTRLVFDYGNPVDWQIGRTTDGYELRLGDAAPAYDLTGVYDLIGRGRLASIWVDPESRALRIGIGCACHAQPFEFRPGIVVVDLKDGPPQQASAFEVALTGEAVPDLAPRPAPRPRARPARFARPTSSVPAEGYDWTQALLGPPQSRQAMPMPEPARPLLPGADPALQPLRDELLQELSRGAARGVVDLALPDLPDVPPSGPGAVQIRIGALPGVRVESDGDVHTAVTAEGDACVADDRLDFANWGTDAPVADQMADARAALIGEFDTPDPDAAVRAVRFLLFIGFGAEAQQVLGQIPTPHPEAAVLASLAHLLDDSPDPAPAFRGMAACDTAAALWAVLGHPALPSGTNFDRAAVLRTFSALPVHLRRLIGPPLVDRLRALDDADAAQSVRDAILRAPGDAGPAVEVMEARLALHNGDPAAAEERLAPLTAISGPATPDAMLAQVETHLAQRSPMTPDQITALEALLHERRDGPDAPRFARALTVARALAGDFDRAFLDLPDVPSAASDVWSLLAEVGPNSALLAHAFPAGGQTPQVSAPVAATLARRLVDLGFAAQAAAWLRQVQKPDIELAARIAVETGDARSALRLLAGSDNPALLPLRTAALAQLADEAALATVLAESGQEEERWRAVSRARDWAQLAQYGPMPLQSLAVAAIGAPTEAPSGTAPSGPLAQSASLLDASARTRGEIADLLATVSGPTPPKP